MRPSCWSAVCLAVLAAGGGCRTVARQVPPVGGAGGETVVLVSLDGFRWDYLELGLTPNLSHLAREGVRAEAMVPVFPTKTFPNHYSIVTGRYPAGHGILGNRFTAPELGRSFSLGDTAAVRDGRFYLAEPIWVTAERQGIRTAPLFWPGNEAPINGVRPSYSLAFDGALPDTTRIRRLLDWLDLPEARRPRFLTFYCAIVDNAGHEYGPDSPHTRQAIARADSLVGILADGLAARSGAGPIDLVVVSDHGMVSTGPDRVIWLDDYVAPGALKADELSALLTAWPAPGLEDSVYRSLQRAPHLTVYRRADLPARLHLQGSERVSPIVAIAEEGWTIAWRQTGGANTKVILGNHGYDDTLTSMRSVFIARGPAFRSGVTVPPFRNIHVYPLLTHLLGIQPVAGEGSLDSVRAVLVERAEDR